jgi:hypothetical protein
MPLFLVFLHPNAMLALPSTKQEHIFFVSSSIFAMLCVLIVCTDLSWPYGAGV